MANKAKANPPKLVPLRDQAQKAIETAETLMITGTRAYTTRRRLMQANIRTARAEYRNGRYAKAAAIARTAHL